MDINFIDKYLTGEITDQELKVLLEWVNANENNRKVFTTLKNIWAVSYTSGKMTTGDIHREFERYRIRMDQIKKPASEDGSAKKSGLTIGQYLLRIAATVLFLYGSLMTYLVLTRDHLTEYTEVRTRNGEKSQLVLADGTVIWINSDSYLRYPSNVQSKNVKVELDGEAYFEVAKIKGRKFTVEASGLNITALGTSFNVKSYKECGAVETTLEEGMVKITGNREGLKMKKPLIMVPNQRVTIYTETGLAVNTASENTTGHTVEKNSIPGKVVGNEAQNVVLQDETNTELYTSWKDGKLQFKKERFEVLAIKLERWYDVKIIIKNTEIKDWRYTGTFENETIEQALTALSLSMPFTYKIDKNAITIQK